MSGKILKAGQPVQIVRGTKSGRTIFELLGKIPQNCVFRNDGDASGGLLSPERASCLG